LHRFRKSQQLRSQIALDVEFDRTALDLGYFRNREHVIKRRVSRVSARVKRDAMSAVVDHYARSLDQIRHPDIARVTQQRNLI